MTTKINGWVAGTVGLAVLMLPGCVQPQEQHPVRVELPGEWKEKSLDLEFSTDSQYLCVAPHIYVMTYGPSIEGRTAVRVFDLSGQAVPEAVDEAGNLQGRFLRLFPGAAWRSYLADFLKAAYGWGFDPERGLGFRMVDNQIMELWRISPERQLLWKSQLLEPDQTFVAGGFLKRDGKDFIFLGKHGDQGYLLSQDDGRVIDTVPYGHIEDDQEVDARRKKLDLFGVWERHDPSGARFWAYSAAMEPSRRLVLCQPSCDG